MHRPRPTRRSCMETARPPGRSQSGTEPLPIAICRSEEHTSELQSHHDLVCRLLLEKKKKEKNEQRQGIKTNITEGPHGIEHRKPIPTHYQRTDRDMQNIEGEDGTPTRTQHAYERA